MTVWLKVINDKMKRLNTKWKPNVFILKYDEFSLLLMYSQQFHNKVNHTYQYELLDNMLCEQLRATYKNNCLKI